MTSVIIVRYFDLKGPKLWKNYAWNMRASSDRNLRPKECPDQKLVENRTSFKKKWGSVFYNFLIQALLRPQIAIQIHANISHVIFSLFWPLKIQISWKKLYGHNPLGMLNHIGFQNFKKVEFWLKNRHFKNVV